MIEKKHYACDAQTVGEAKSLLIYVSWKEY